MCTERFGSWKKRCDARCVGGHVLHSPIQSVQASLIYRLIFVLESRSGASPTVVRSVFSPML